MRKFRWLQFDRVVRWLLVVGMAGLAAFFMPQATLASPLQQIPPYAVNVSFISILPSPSYVGVLVTMTVRVAAVDPLAGIPAGTVRIESDTTLLCSLALDGAGEATCTYSFTTPGIVPLKAVYLGQSPFLPGVSSNGFHTVQPRLVPAVSILSHTPDPSIINRVVTSEVMVGGSSPTATGTVTVFRSNATCTAPTHLTALDRCSAALDGSGKATCSMPLSVSGEVYLCAYYSGDVAHVPGLSNSALHRVSLSNTFTTITSTTPFPSLLGQSVWVNFSVTSPDGIPSGIVTVTSAGLSCSATAAQGRCALTFATPHLNPVVAAYGGGMDGSVVLDPSVSAPFNHRVNVPPTDIRLSADSVEGYLSTGALVGMFSAEDANLDETHTFSLVSGAGSEDNALFSITGNELHTADVLTPGERLAIRVRATDPAGLQFEEVFDLWVDGQIVLPNTGFAAGRVTVLAGAGNPLAAQKAELILEIPALGVRVDILGVPRTASSWDTDWLGSAAGWLEGTAFPSWKGNSLLAGHNYLPSGLPGPFNMLETLRWGDELLVRGYGETTVYQVRSVERTAPDDLTTLQHEEQPWLTLITCKSYDEAAQRYRLRIVVRAVAVDRH